MEENIKVVVFDIYGVLVDLKGILNESVFKKAKELKEGGKYKLVLCSNSSEKIVDIWNQKYDFVKYFDGMVLADDVKANKPEPEIYQAIVDLYDGIQPQNILFIDDKDENVLGAEAERLIGRKYEGDIEECLKDI